MSLSRYMYSGKEVKEQLRITAKTSFMFQKEQKIVVFIIYFFGGSNDEEASHDGGSIKPLGAAWYVSRQ